jgi:D-aminoacyl-tRNA deacylase
MRLVIQRVSKASVTVADELVGSIGRGLLVLAGFHTTDSRETAEYLARKVSQLRIFSDEAGKMNRSVQEIAGEVLVVSQFTLYGDVLKGNRPSFVEAARPDVAERLYKEFVSALEGQLGPNRVRTGRFQAMMEVSLVNEGPVTILMDKCQ